MESHHPRKLSNDNSSGASGSKLSTLMQRFGASFKSLSQDMKFRPHFLKTKEELELKEKLHRVHNETDDIEVDLKSHSEKMVNDKNINNWVMHLYRSEMTRLIGYRIRMDTCTQWAITTVASVTLLILNNDHIPADACIVAVLFLVLFCSIESRRFIFYQNIRNRTVLMERGFFVECMLRAARAQINQTRAEDNKFTDADFSKLCYEVIGEVGMGRKYDLVEFAKRMYPLYASHLFPQPTLLSFWEAFHVRFVRIYYYLLVFVWLIWILKLDAIHQLHHKKIVVVVLSALHLVLYVVSFWVLRMPHPHVQHVANDLTGA